MNNNKEIIDRLYQRLSDYLISKGYEPIFIKYKDYDNIYSLFFIGNIETSVNIVYALHVREFEKIEEFSDSDTQEPKLILCEGALYNESSDNGLSNLSMGCWGGIIFSYCDIPDTIMKEFDESFNEYINGGIEQIEEDRKVLYEGMKSGISFESPQQAIADFIKQKECLIR